jgi:E3 ubiquitin-protein ligase EDD1
VSRELAAESALDLDVFNLSSADKSKKSMIPGKKGDTDDLDPDIEYHRSLFWQPGKRGYYAPRPGKNTPERMNAFRNVGR